MKKVFLSLILFLAAAVAQAAPKDAVVRIPSHGGSGTVIATGPGWSLILTAGHMFRDDDRLKTTIVLDVPVPPGTKTAPIKPGSKTQVLAVDINRDAALLRLNYGPLPYVTPVAPRNFQPGDCLSVGYDEMRQPATVRPARIVTKNGYFEFTDRRPWHGRSGGALIDIKSGMLVGICSGYTGPRDHQEIEHGYLGVYSELNAILDFLHGVKGISIDEGVPPAPTPRSSCPSCPNGQCPRAPPASVPWTPVPPSFVFPPLDCPH